MTALKSPYPYFGGKSKVADVVWQHFGDVRNYIEPFFGSGAMLLGAPWPANRIETVNDIDGMISNFWRALQRAPEDVAHHADWPVNENDLHARHYWLVCQKESLQERLEGDPDYYDSKIAGWWVWGMACWIGHNFCSGEGPWTVENNQMIKTDAGRGINRQLPHLGDAGRGINRKLPHLGDAGQGILDYMLDLSNRIRNVRVACGDWTRICGPTPTSHMGLTAIFLDPPYSDDVAIKNVTYNEYDFSLAHKVREYAIEHGDDPQLRIALCGYENEHEMPRGWSKHRWSAKGGYANNNSDNNNRHKETIWFSPHCIKTCLWDDSEWETSRPIIQPPHEAIPTQDASTRP